MSIKDTRSPWTIPVLKQYLADKFFLSKKQYLQAGGFNKPDLQLRLILGVESHPIRRGLQGLFRRQQRTLRDLQMYLGRISAKNRRHVPTATKEAMYNNSKNPFLRLPGEILNMVDDYLDLRDMVALRLASRDLFTRFILPKQVFESATIIDETLAPFLDANQYRKTSLIRLEIQGKLAVRLHGKMYKMFYCNACGTAHIEPYFMRSQLVESPYIRSCGLDQSGDWRYRSTLQSLRKELEDRKRRVWGILRGNRMTVKREFYVGIANHGLQMATSSDFGRGMELFLENAPLCRHARKYHGRKIQKLIQFAHCKAGRKTSTGFKHDVSSKTGRYRTFGTWRLC